MNDIQREFLLDRLSRLKMPYVEELLRNGAEPIVILDAFESFILERSEEYQRFLQHNTTQFLSQQILSIMKDRFIQEGIHKDHQFRMVYFMLKVVGEDWDCGCGSTESPAKGAMIRGENTN